MLRNSLVAILTFIVLTLAYCLIELIGAGDRQYDRMIVVNSKNQTLVLEHALCDAYLVKEIDVALIGE